MKRFFLPQPAMTHTFTFSAGPDWHSTIPKGVLDMVAVLDIKARSNAEDTMTACLVEMMKNHGGRYKINSEQTPSCVNYNVTIQTP